MSVPEPADAPLRRGRRAAALLLCLVALGGCAGRPDARGAVATAVPASDTDLRAYVAEWGQRSQSDPGDKTAALNYAQGLRRQTQYAQAAAVLQQAAIKHPYDHEILAAYGKALLDAGRLGEAQEVLARAHTPDHPDWSVLSAQGAIADQMGDHTTALNYYQAALKIVPGEPRVLSNLGLSYALARDLPMAETTLRQAAASPQADARVRQNLALVLALEGKTREAQAASERDLSPAEAATNIAAIERMVAQSDPWQTLQQLNGSKPARAGTGRVALKPPPAAGNAAAPAPAAGARAAQID